MRHDISRARFTERPNLAMTPEMKADITRLGKALGMNWSEAVRKALAEFIEKHEDKL